MQNSVNMLIFWHLKAGFMALTQVSLYTDTGISYCNTYQGHPRSLAISLTRFSEGCKNDECQCAGGWLGGWASTIYFRSITLQPLDMGRSL